MNYPENKPKGTNVVTSTADWLNHTDFIRKAKQLVTDYSNEHNDSFNQIHTIAEVEPVWYSRTAETQKVILKTSILDDRYYEATYAAQYNCIYFDAYRKEKQMRYEL